MYLCSKDNSGCYAICMIFTYYTQNVKKDANIRLFNQQLNNVIENNMKKSYNLGYISDEDIFNHVKSTVLGIIGTGTTDSRQITNQRTCPYDSAKSENRLIGGKLVRFITCIE